MKEPIRQLVRTTRFAHIDFAKFALYLIREYNKLMRSIAYIRNYALIKMLKVIGDRF